MDALECVRDMSPRDGAASVSKYLNGMSGFHDGANSKGIQQLFKSAEHAVKTNPHANACLAVKTRSDSLAAGVKVAEGAATKDGENRSKNALHCRSASIQSQQRHNKKLER